MALIKCPECGTDVSDKAVACLKCAHPIVESSPPEQAQTVEAQNIEKTARKNKVQILIGVFLMISGFFLIIFSVSGQQWNLFAWLLGVFATIGGVIWIVIAEFSSWRR